MRRKTNRSANEELWNELRKQIEFIQALWRRESKPRSRGFARIVSITTTELTLDKDGREQ